MPRSLIPVLLTLALLSGCVAQQAPQVSSSSTEQVPRYPTVETWLELAQKVSEMDTAQVQERLEQVDRADGVGQQFYFGVLNQQLPNYGAWTLARDTFQKLQDNEELPAQNRQLAQLLRKYNQSRINSYVRQSELQQQHSLMEQEVQKARDEQRLLEQKIQALTELETVISTRKEE